MSAMLKYQYRRLFRKPGFYICTGILAAFVLLNFIAKMSTYYSDMDGKTAIDYFIESYSPESYTAGILSTYSFLITTMIAIFTSMFICEDRQVGTIKNIYSKGYARWKVFMSDFIVSSTAAALMYIAVCGVSFIPALAIGAKIGSSSIETNGFYDFYFSESSEPGIQSYWTFMLGLFLVYIAINSLYIVIAELLKSTGGSIALNIFAPTIISIVIAIIEGIIYEMTKNHDLARILYQNWIYSILTNMSIHTSMKDFVQYIFDCFIYILGFGALGLLISTKRQIKG